MSENCPKRAIALKYPEGNNASKNRSPKILASGAGEIAQAIIESAKAHGIPIKQHEPISSLLSKLPIESEVSPKTFRLVAEVITFLSDCDNDFKTTRK